MSQQKQQCSKHIQHTGMYVGDARKRYEKEMDPIGLNNWEDVKWPLTLHSDRVHFYENSNDSIGLLRQNPFTRQPIQSLHDWEPIVHDDLSVEDYRALLNALHQRGWRNVDCVKRDLVALQEASQGAQHRPELATMALEDVDRLFAAECSAPRVDLPYLGYRPKVR